MHREPDFDVPLHIVAEAACWIARLHGPGRSPRMERQCRAWQASSQLHRLAFERCTAAWDLMPGIAVGSVLADESEAAGAVRDLLDKLAASSGRRRRD